ncbi:hypothetical protein ABIF23_007474 [Bradyrhizobium elkanii]
MPIARPAPNTSRIGGHRGVGEAGEPRQDRLHIGEDREQPAEAEHRHGKSEQDLRAAEHGELLAQRRGLVVGADMAGDQHRQHDERDHADRRHRPERRAPAEHQAEPGAEGHAEQGREGEPDKHRGDCRGALVFRDEACRHHRSDAEEGAVRQRGENARRHQEPVARRQRTRRIAEREDRHQRQQDRLARHPPRCQRQDRRADEHAERIAGDQQASRGYRYLHVGGDLQQQSHDEEFGGADAKGTGGQGKDCSRHVSLRTKGFRKAR